MERGEKKERETVAAERVNTNAAGKADVKREARVAGDAGVMQVGGRQMVRAVFSLDFKCDTI